MKSADLTNEHAGRLITWTRNNTVHKSRPFAIEHAAGHVYLHIDGWSAHELRADQDVEVTPQPPRKEG